MTLKDKYLFIGGSCDGAIASVDDNVDTVVVQLMKYTGQVKQQQYFDRGRLPEPVTVPDGTETYSRERIQCDNHIRHVFVVNSGDDSAVDPLAVLIEAYAERRNAQKT